MWQSESAVDRRTALRTGAALASLAVAGCLDAVEDPGEADDPDGGPGAGGAADGSGNGGEADGEAFVVETVATGLRHPWSLAFLPDDGLLVTERDGRLNLVDRTDGTTTVVDGTPEVWADGQGGLHDVVTHPAYPDENWVYLTYAARDEDQEGGALHVGRGRLDRDAATLDEYELLHVANPFVPSNGHYGGRLTFHEGEIYVTSGDRQFKNFGPDHVSQDATNELGATLRLTPDGSIPEDNPFVDDDDVRDAIYSYGHRNAQGMTVHPETGEIWQSEHGEEDGDEINVLEAGGNYGWPIAHTGCEYGTDDPVGDHPEDRDDVVDPVYYWECTTGGFPPAGATFYDGDAFPEWQGDLFVGGLATRTLARFAVDGREVEPRAPLLEEEGWRIRDVAVAPDTGHLHVAVDASDAPVVRLVPDG